MKWILPLLLMLPFTLALNTTVVDTNETLVVTYYLPEPGVEVYIWEYTLFPYTVNTYQYNYTDPIKYVDLSLCPAVGPIGFYMLTELQMPGPIVKTYSYYGQHKNIDHCIDVW